MQLALQCTIANNRWLFKAIECRYWVTLHLKTIVKARKITTLMWVPGQHKYCLAYKHLDPDKYCPVLHESGSWEDPLGRFNYVLCK